MNNRRERSKRTLSVLLALVLVLTALPILAWADDGDDGHVHAEDYGDVLDVEVGPQAEDTSPLGAAPNTYEEKQWLWEHPVSGSLIWHTDIFGGLHIGGWESIPSFNSADDQPWRSIDRASITSVYFDYDEQPEIESLDHWFDGFINLADDCIFDPASCAIISSVSPIASDRCNITGCTCATCGFYYYDYKPDPIDEENAHICDVHCDGCSASGGIWVTRSHTFSGNRCTLCGYTKSCSHSSTSRTWTTGCDYKDVCTSCGAVVRTGTSHGPYSYGSWSYYSSSQHRRTQTCDYGDWSGYDYASHSTTTSYGQYSSTQHSVRSYCSECGSYVGSTSYSSHSFTYGSWTNYSSTQHRRTKTCSTCGYSEYEYESHSLNYGNWTSTGSSQHQRTVSCSCGYSTTETAAHTLTRTAWTSDGAAQHKRTASCGTCGYSTTEKEAHSLTDGAWGSISDTQHQRTKSCSCGYSTTETKSHSLTYGKWAQHNATQHKRTKSCSCGYSGTEYAAHTMFPGRWASVSDTQHSRANACECGHTATETASHADSDGDGNCDSCQYLMTRFSVTVPTSLSLGMSQAGQIYAATTAQIVNNSTGAVTVTGVKFTTANGWTLVPYTTNMANAKVNSKCIGFTINGAASTVTGSTEAKTTAWQIAKGASLPLDYAAVVSATSRAVNEQVLTVVFVVGWAS